jgi:hypothetical protein
MGITSATPERPACCPVCGEAIPSNAELPYFCADGGGACCPYCWMPSARADEWLEPCVHRLASGASFADDWYVSPFDDGADLPWLDELPEGRYWSDAQRAEAFGELLPLFAAYEDFRGPDALPRRHEILDMLIERLRLPVLSSFREDFVMGMIEVEFDYFTPDATPARAAFTRELNRLRAAFDRLAATSPSEPFERPERWDW